MGFSEKRNIKPSSAGAAYFSPGRKSGVGLENDKGRPWGATVTGLSRLQGSGKVGDERKVLFEFLDHYVRTKHNCFLAELDLTSDGRCYQLCFRPLREDHNSPNRYACRYLRFAVEECALVIVDGTLTAVIAESLDNELPALAAKV